MNTANNYNLKPHNTLAVNCRCQNYLPVNSLSDLERLPQDLPSNQAVILGGGSNILFSQDLEKTVIHIKPRKYIISSDNLVIAWAGTPWHELVKWSIAKGLGGIENLALIPGLCGAAAVQNIGAYGVELQDILAWVEVYNWQTATYQRLTKQACHFGYRESIFQQQTEPWVISRIALDLRSNKTCNIEYQALSEYLQQQHITEINPQNVFDAVVAIRQSKLPDPQTLANAGSFFKNPIINSEQKEQLQKRHPEMPLFATDKVEQYKVPAAWLLEDCGFKGYRQGDAGFYEQHALIMVNHGNANGQQLQRLAELASRMVKKKFDIDLEPEVKII